MQMTADHARKIAEAYEQRERAIRNLDNAVKMPRPEDEKVAAAGEAAAIAEGNLHSLLRAQEVDFVPVSTLPDPEPGLKAAPDPGTSAEGGGDLKSDPSKAKPKA